MANKYCVALTFLSHTIYAERIDQFRSRFDPNYRKMPMNYLPLLPTFELEEDGLPDFAHDMADDVLVEFEGLRDSLTVPMLDFDYYCDRDNHALFVVPEFPADLLSGQEAITDVVSRHAVELSPATLDGGYVRLGTWPCNDDLHEALKVARTVFDFPFELVARDVALFELSRGVWMPRYTLTTFSPEMDRSLRHLEMERPIILS